MYGVLSFFLIILNCQTIQTIQNFGNFLTIAIGQKSHRKKWVGGPIDIWKPLVRERLKFVKFFICQWAKSLILKMGQKTY